MKLYIYRSYSLHNQSLVDSGYFYAKSRDNMRARIAREHKYCKTTVSETLEKPTQMMDIHGKPVKGGISLINPPTFIGEVLSLETVAPTWTDAKGGYQSFNRETGKLYGEKKGGN